MPSFKAKSLQRAVKDAGIDLKLARDEEIFYVFKLAIWVIHRSLLVHVPRVITEEIIQSEAEAIWEISKDINGLSKRKPLRDKLTASTMKKINELFNEAISLAGTIIKIYNNQDQSGSRILLIYQLCDQLKEIFDFLEGEDIDCNSIDPTTAIECSFEAIIKINYKRETIAREKMYRLRSNNSDIVKFCFCKNSILKWHKQLSKITPYSIEESIIYLFEESITESKCIIEHISYGETIGNKLDMHEINNILNTAASQIGEVATIYKIENPAMIQRRLRLLAAFKDQLGELHERLRLSKIDCSKVLT